MNHTENEPVRTEDELEFAVFCIENLAIKLGKNARDVYTAIKDRSSILNSYIVPGYDFLHTQDKEYVLEDIEEIMKDKGVSV